MKTLVLGLDNDILSDDAIDQKLTKYLEAHLHNPVIQYKSLAIGGVEIIEMIKDYDKAIIIDSI